MSMEYDVASCRRTCGCIVAFFIMLMGCSTYAADTAATRPNDVKILRDIAYKDSKASTDYEKEWCKLDVYAPAKVSAESLPVLVWFYGGGLTNGKKNDGAVLAQSWARQGLVVVVPNYRLSPKATYPAYLEDAAASTAWAFKHIAGHGGNPKKIFVTGHSAGGYLAAQIAADPKYLAAYDLKPSDLAGTIPIAGQVFTHFTIRHERGIANARVKPIIDVDAPVYHVSKEMIPTLLFVGDKDMSTRLEETQYMVALAKHVGAKDIELKVIANRNHGTIMNKMADPTDPGWQAMLEFIRKH